MAGERTCPHTNPNPQGTWVRLADAPTDALGPEGYMAACQVMHKATQWATPKGYTMGPEGLRPVRSYTKGPEGYMACKEL